MTEIDRDKSDHQRDQRDDFEVDKALDAHATDALQVAVPGDTGDESGKDQWGDDSFDEPQEDVAENTKADRQGGRIEAQLRACDHRNEYPRCERAPADSEYGQQQDRSAAQCETPVTEEWTLGRTQRYSGGE